MAKRGINEKHKKNSLTNKIVSLTVFLDALFLVLILASTVLMFLISNNQTRDYNANYQNEIIIQAIEDTLSDIENDVHELAIDENVITYLEYINEGNTPILNEGDASYSIYSNFLRRIQAIVEYQEDDLYDLVFLATEFNCSSGIEGCFITQEEDMSSADYYLTDRAWYQALDGIDFAVSDPYIDAITGKWVVTYTQKVYDQTNVIGYVGIDVHLDTLALLIDEMKLEKLPEENEIIIFNDIEDDTRLIYFSADSYEDYLMQSSHNFLTIDQANEYRDGMSFIYDNYSTEESIIDSVFELGSFVIIANEIENTNLSVITLYYNSQTLGVEWMFFIVVALASLLVLFVALSVNKSIKLALSPIDEILSSIGKIQSGDYKVHVDIDGTEEFQKIGAAINVMSAEIEKQVQLTYESLAYDISTGLKNRASSSKHLDETIFKSERRAAVCLIQVDNLKSINVTKGQFVGDNLIKAIADELKRVFRSHETLFSNGGNEFIYIKNDISSLQEVEYALNRLLAHFKEPTVVKSIRAEVKFNVGVSIYPTDGNKLDELINKCDTALFKATETSFKKIIFYNDKIARSVSYQAEISEQLAKAIKKKQIYLKYQPLISNTSEIYGFEALARWTSPTLGDITPQVFIANAEESYLIIPIGTWILREACNFQVELKEKYEVDYMISVNVSPVQILQRDFVEIVKKIVRETDINPDFLTLEITESLFIESSVLLEDTIEQLHNMGVKLSLDDFGTGYASLTYLRQINFDNLKIDKTFVDGIFANIKDHRIIGTIVNLVHDLDMKVIAEGVETRKQYEYLREINTDIFQGYIFAKPLSTKDIFDFIVEFYKIPSHKRADVYASLNE